MSGKTFLIILAGLAVGSFGVSLAVSLLTGGGGGTPTATTRPAKPRPRGFLAKLAETPEVRRQLMKQQQLEELIRDLQARREQYERKVASLSAREGRLRLAEEALARRAKQLEKLRMELVGPLTRLKDAVAELERSRVVVDKQEKAALMAIAAKYDRMDPIKGAETLSNMFLGGQEEDVTRILHYMSERTAAKVLENMTGKDPKTGQVLSARVTEMLKRIQEQG